MSKLLAIAMAFVVIAIPCLSFATSQAPSDRDARGKTFLMCNAETDTGVCEGTNGDTFAVVDKYETFTFHLTETGTGSLCDLYFTHELATPTSASTLVPATTDLSTFATNRVNSTNLSLADDKITISGDFHYVWVLCTAMGTTTTVYMHAAVGLQRNQSQ